MNTVKNKNLRGQITLTLLVGWVFFLIIATVIVDSALMVNEKIKLQNTADISALAGAQMLRLKANRVIWVNKKLNELWEETQQQLLMPSPCLFMPCSATANCHTCPYIEAARIAYIMALFSAKFQTYISVLYGPPDQNYDMSQELEGDLINANQMAAKIAFLNSLAEKNVPPLLAQKIKKAYLGSYPDINELASIYMDTENNGPTIGEDSNNDGVPDTLKDIYGLYAPFRFYPLGDFEIKKRRAWGINYIWRVAQSTCSARPDMVCIAPPIPAPLYNLPYGIYSKRDFKPVYFHAIVYKPILPFDFPFPSIDTASGIWDSVVPKNPFAMWTSENKRIRRQRLPLVAVSAAAPTGGEIPYNGNSGHDFDSEKLIGINDRNSVQDYLDYLLRMGEDQPDKSEMERMMWLRSMEDNGQGMFGAYSPSDFLH